MKTIALSTIASILMLQPALAKDDFSYHSKAASKHSVLASAQATKATVSIASAAVAIPISVAGGASLAVGNVSQNVAKNLRAISKDDKPVVLIVTDKVITRDPSPAQVLENN